MASIYQSAEIMIYPSFFEGFGIPILEALFSKTPVITSKGGCFTETGGPHSKYINPISCTDLKEAIIEIQNSVELQERMKEQNKGKAQPEFLSTHPSADNRIKQINDWTNKIILDYPPIKIS